MERNDMGMGNWNLSRLKEERQNCVAKLHYHKQRLEDGRETLKKAENFIRYHRNHVSGQEEKLRWIDNYLEAKKKPIQLTDDHWLSNKFTISDLNNKEGILQRTCGLGKDGESVIEQLWFTDPKTSHRYLLLEQPIKDV